MANTGTGAERVRRRRGKLRAAGFAEECARQARLIRDAETPESRAEDEAWFEVSDKTGWTA
jgi:hypothetical protein